jgi:phage baseplate assembly protein W
MAEARSYSFKSVGEDLAQKRQQASQIASAPPPIGIKTPIELGDTGDGLLKMHRNLADQVRDNLRNLIMTNHGERLNFYDFGANLIPILSELASEDGDMEAMRRIQTAVSKYMPFVSLENFSSAPIPTENAGQARIKILVTYSVARANITSDVISVTLNFIG